MKARKLRTPEERVGTLPNGALPPPAQGVPPPPASGPHGDPDAGDPRSTEGLLRRALLHRDTASLERVIHRMRPEMLRLAAAHVHSYDDAEDVLQDTWVAALSAIHRFQGRASLRTWLLRILTYRARSAMRRNSRSVPLSHLSAPDHPAGPVAVEGFPGLSRHDPEEALARADLQRRLATAMTRLPDRQRRVVQLRDFEGCSPVEVCARLEVSPANQRVLLHRGRTELRRQVAM